MDPIVVSTFFPLLHAQLTEGQCVGLYAELAQSSITIYAATGLPHRKTPPTRILPKQ